MTSFEYDRATRASVFIALGALLAIAGCDNGTDPDAGVDAGDDMTDAGDDMMDAGDDMDAGDEDDAGADDDGGLGDGGDGDGGDGDGGVDDGGITVGGGAATSAQIQAVLDATPGVTSLMVDDAVVTYIKPAVDDGIDGTGFFVQAEQMGPALLVLVDPTGLTPTPTPGQVVDFEVTEVAIDDSTTGDGSNIVYAASIDGWFVDSNGHDTSFLVQDVSAVDLVTNLDDYTGELVSLTGEIAEDFGFAGTGFRAAQITTAGVTTATADLRFRVPADVLSGSALAAGCTVDIGPTPMWRFDTAAQPAAWRAGDFTVTDCPAPTTAGDLVITEIGYQFTGADDAKEYVEIYNPSSDASFGLDGCILSDEDGPTSGTALTISSGAIVGPGQYVVIAGTVATSEILGDAVLPTGLELADMDLVQLHCGGTQIDVVDWSTSGFDSTMDEVSIQLDPAASATDGATNNDTLTNWCLTPDTETYGTMSRRGTPGAANVACFTPAIVRVNELNANITGGCDLIELRVVAGGTMAGYELRERTSTVLTFPVGFTVMTNDIIVVHFDSGDTSCTGGGAAPADETAAVDGVPASSVSSNYDTAFDFYSSDGGLTGTDNVIWIRDATGTIIDAVLVTDDASGTAAGGSESAAADVAAAGEWEIVGGGIPTGGFVDDDFNMHAALDLDATGTDASGDTIQRDDDADSDDKDDWVVAAESWGVINTGQSAL